MLNPILRSELYMEHIILREQKHSRVRTNDILHVVYRNFANALNRSINIKIKMAELKVAWIIAYIIGVPLYIYATATNFDTWKAVLLFVIAGGIGILNLGRLALKFFKELLAVIIAYREQSINIHGVKYLYLIIFLLIIIIILIVICLILFFK
jgi:hypothetical protein